MNTTNRRPIADYLSMTYPYQVIADPDGGYFVQFPDLPGCMTQVEERDDIGAMADEIRELWIETVYERGDDVPLPSTSAGYSGKFVMRISRSLHRTLAQSAEQEGISLNQYAAVLLARGDALSQVERRLDALGQQLDALHEGLRFTVSGVPSATKKPELQLLVGQKPVAA